MITPERLPNETARCYERFKYWVNLGNKRSLGRVAKKFRLCRKSIEIASSKHKWGDRLRAYQQQQHEDEMAAEAQAKLEAARERQYVLEQRRASVEENTWELWLRFREKVAAMLNFPIELTETEKDGEGNHYTIYPGKWTFDTTAKMAQVADGLVRLGLGIPGARMELTGKDGAPLAGDYTPTINITYLSDKESRQMIEEAKPLKLNDKDDT